ncbi:MAG: DNA polymerase III subunit delta [Gammaproteobacteria bacterium]
MNRAFNDLERLLKSPLPPVCALIGSEAVLILYCLQKIRAKAQADGFPSRNFILADAGTDFSTICTGLGSGSLFADKQFTEVLVPDSSGGMTGKIESGLVTLVEASQAEDLLLLSVSSTASKRSKKNWLKAVSERGQIIDIEPLKQREQRQWIKSQLVERNIELTLDELDLLFYSTEGNLLAAWMELERLSLLTGSADSELGLSDDQGKANVFQLADACMEGKITRALRLLKLIRTADIQSAPLVFGVLGRYVSLAYRLMWAKESGESLAQAMAREKLWRRDQDRVASLLSRLSASVIRAIARRMEQVDQTIKGQNPAQDAWYELTSLVLALCGVFPFRAPAKKRL